MVEDPCKPKGHGGLIVAIVLVTLLACGFVFLVPAARCPMCPYISPQRPGMPGCHACDDGKRVSLYDRWRILKLLRSMGVR